MPKTIDQQLADLRIEYAQARTELDRKIITARAGLLQMAKDQQTNQTSRQQRIDVET